MSSNGARNNSSHCYKDGPELPALNFTTTCITSGRYVTFYNERLHGVTYPDGYADPVYTELCEVTVLGKNIYKSFFFLAISTTISNKIAGNEQSKFKYICISCMSLYLRIFFGLPCEYPSNL